MGRSRAVLVGVVSVVAGLVASCGAVGGNGAERGGSAPTSPVPPAVGPIDPASLPAPPPLAWAPCPKPSHAPTALDDAIDQTDALPKLDYECASLTVPVDYAQVEGATMQIALIRTKATVPERRVGSLVVNPGGPGASGVDFLRTWAPTISEKMRGRFDLVSFDPRGVGDSSPVRCLTTEETEANLSVDPAPVDDAGRRALEAQYRSVSERCRERAAAVLPFLGTNNVARDMDRVRIALHEERLTYLGFSYGTRLGAVYAEKFPTRVRAMVLDGAVDPGSTGVGFRREQSVGFEVAFQRFVDDCKEKADKCPIAADPQQAYDAVLARTRAEPLATKHPDRAVDAGRFLNAATGALYSKALWPVLAQGLATAQVSGDGTLLLAANDLVTERRNDGTYPNTSEMNSAVNCLDYGDRHEPHEVAAHAAEQSQQAPRFGALTTFTVLACSAWPAPPDPIASRISSTDLGPVVVVGTTGDPATPYTWAQRMHAAIPTSRLVTLEGDGHTAYGTSMCVTRAVDSYLIDGVAPGTDVTCRK